MKLKSKWTAFGTLANFAEKDYVLLFLRKRGLILYLDESIAKIWIDSDENVKKLIKMKRSSENLAVRNTKNGFEPGSLVWLKTK